MFSCFILKYIINDKEVISSGKFIIYNVTIEERLKELLVLYNSMEYKEYL